MTTTVPLTDMSGPRPTYAWERGAPDERGTELALVRRCARHDADALHEIVRRYQPRLFRFLRRIIGSHEDTEEAVQDVFLRVWQQAHRFDGRASFATWLYRVAANVAYDTLRRRKTQCPALTLADVQAVSPVNAEEEALNGLARAERTGRIQQALLRLRAEDRLVLVLYYTEELEYDEMCRITGYAYPLLKVRLARARKRLRSVLESLGQEEGE